MTECHKLARVLVPGFTVGTLGSPRRDCCSHLARDAHRDVRFVTHDDRLHRLHHARRTVGARVTILPRILVLLLPPLPSLIPGPASYMAIWVKEVRWPIRIPSTDSGSKDNAAHHN